MWNMLQQFKKYLLIKDYGLHYYNEMSFFFKYLEQHQLTYLDFSFEIFTDYLLYKKNKNCKEESLNIAIKSIRSFYNYIVTYNDKDKSYIETAYKIKILQVKRKIFDYLTEEELKELYVFCARYMCWLEPIKVKAVLYILYYTGIRIGEFLNLKRKDIDLKNNIIYIRLPNKAKKERKVPFTKKLRPILKEYFATELEECNAFNMTAGKLSNMLINYIKDCKPNNKNVSWHTFRRSFAHWLARNKIDIKVAQKLLGHASLESTAIYYDPDIEEAIHVYRKTFDT